MTIKDADWGYRILRKMPSAEQATLVEKIILYLGEYIDESTVEELQMAWKSIGQRMGFVSAGDARRAAEKASLEKGLDTVMTKEFDENGAVFSGGESQKLAVSRTFAKPSDVKIFDEPSSALDPIAEYDLFKNIAKEGNEHTLLFISHRLSSVKHCDKVFMLEKGTLVEEGSHEELMALDGKYAKMYRRQANNYLAIEDGTEGA